MTRTPTSPEAERTIMLRILRALSFGRSKTDMEVLDWADRNLKAKSLKIFRELCGHEATLIQTDDLKHRETYNGL
jgi:hypothetical protein